MLVVGCKCCLMVWCVGSLKIWVGYEGQIGIYFVIDTKWTQIYTNPCIPYWIYIRLELYFLVRQHCDDFSIVDALVYNGLSNLEISIGLTSDFCGTPLCT